MSLLTDWRDYAYSKELNSSKEGQIFWSNYFTIEKGIYEFRYLAIDKFGNLNIQYYYITVV